MWTNICFPFKFPHFWSIEKNEFISDYKWSKDLIFPAILMFLWVISLRFRLDIKVLKFLILFENIDEDQKKRKSDFMRSYLSNEYQKVF